MADQHNESDHVLKRFNLSNWALTHQTLVLYLMLMLVAAGALAYTKLGQSEDPPFTFKLMLVRTSWPGASAVEVANQITDKIEEKVQEIEAVDYVSSYSRPGESVVFVLIKDDTFSDRIPDLWYEVRKKVGDIKHTLPNDIESLSFNDEFSDVYGTMYALRGDGFDNFALKEQAEQIRAELLTVDDVEKVVFFGEQAQRIYIEFSNAKFSTIGLTSQQLISILRAQNMVVRGGTYDSPDERIRIQVSGRYKTLDDLRNTHLRVGKQDFVLGDVAKIYRGYQDPPKSTNRFNGDESLLIGVSMREGGDVIKMGKALAVKMQRIESKLPIGIKIDTVTSQAKVVAASVNDFAGSLVEAVVIVLAVSLLSLGLRTGFVVAITIPVVLAATFLVMYIYGIGLHKISLGALILALGLLVDDAIIAVEMMSSKMEQGLERVKAASFAFNTTAIPMLTGTMVTVAGFLPIATAASSTGEYTRSIFQVSAISLSLSWIAAVIFVPYLGYHLLPDYSEAPQSPKLMQWLKKRLNLNNQNSHEHNNGVHHHDIYNTPFYSKFRSLVTWCVQYRKTVIIITVLAFLLSVIGFGKVQQQFFPDSTRLEIVVDMRLTEGASYAATNQQVKKLEQWLEQWNKAEQGLVNYVSYVGTGAPRYYLPLNVELPHRGFAQMVISTKNYDAREAIRRDLINLFENDFPALRASVSRLENGPPVGFPVQFRVNGPDIPEARKVANQVADIMRENPNLMNVQLGWEAPSKVVKVDVDQAKARLLGINSVDIANTINGAMQELYISEFREGNERIDLVARGTQTEQAPLSLTKFNCHWYPE